MSNPGMIGLKRARSAIGAIMLVMSVVPASASIQLMGITTIPEYAAGIDSPIGGVSGVDFDPQSGIWYLISDDKSERGSARYWQTTIRLAVGTPPQVEPLRTVTIRRPEGGYYPAPGSGNEALDAESLRKVPGSGSIVWSSEGDTRDGFGPALRTMQADGRSSKALPLPPIFAFDPAQSRGPRANLSFEGLSFEPGGKHLWVSLEAPLIQDGPLASREDGATVRLSRLIYPRLSLSAQFAYRVDPIGPAPPQRLADNGVSEIIALDRTHLLVLERSGVQQPDGDFTYRARLYCADLGRAQNIASRNSLRDGNVAHASKRLVFDFRNVTSPIVDNVEGMTLGPKLPNGSRTIVFVTDNDFSPRRQTQVIALEIAPRHKRATLVETLCQPAN